MLLGILCTMINGFGRKGYYNSQEIGLARALALMGHKVIIYKGVQEGAETVHFEKNIIIHYIEMPHLGANGYFSPKMLNKKLDGLLCFSDQQLFLPHVYRYCKKHNIPFVPYIGTAHSLYTGSLKGAITNKLFSMGTLKMYQKIPLIAKTPSAKEELEDLGILSDITVAPVGLDMADMHRVNKDEVKTGLREKYGFSPDSVLLCNISRMQPEKRITELIDLFNRIKDQKPFQMLLVGEGDLESDVDKKIIEAGLKDRIKRIPKIPYRDIWEVYAMSDYFINMNQGEIFGMACMESVYYETPVVAISAIGPRITLKDMKGHFLCDTDQEIENTLCAPYPAAKDLKESSKEAEKRYSWEFCGSIFLNLISNGKSQ